MSPLSQNSQSLKRGLTIALLLFCMSYLPAQQTAQKFIQETQYLLYLPDKYAADTLQKWPVMIFLHGSGERGTDIEKVKIHGPAKLAAAGKKYPFIVVSPQAPEGGGWDTETLYRLLGNIKRNYRVDPERVYLTGLSMGGFGTWALAMKHPEEFAAIVPICGGGDTTEAWKLRHIPAWCFHGALDDAVPVAMDQKMVEAAGKYNPSVKFTVYPDANHNSWERTYKNDSVYEWLLAQKRFRYKQVDASAEQLKKYIGRYVNPSNDTVNIVVEGEVLTAKTSKQSFPLKLAGGDTFFIQEQLAVELVFGMNEKGRVDSFMLLEDKKTRFRKI